jgi:hypothetical protein
MQENVGSFLLIFDSAWALLHTLRLISGVGLEMLILLFDLCSNTGVEASDCIQWS